MYGDFAEMHGSVVALVFEFSPQSLNLLLQGSLFRFMFLENVADFSLDLPHEDGHFFLAI
jgi:hypothetical protein